MTALRVIPTWRHGRERLYVCLPDGRNVAWYDRDAARVSVVHRQYGEGALDALAPFLSGDVTVGPPPVPNAAELARLTLHPDDDLAPNRPGEALQIAIEREPGRVAGGRFLRADPRRLALEAEEAVGGALDGFEGAGWRTLHSIPLPGGDRIPHLLIGPGGIFALHSLHARRRRVRVGDPVVSAGRTAAPLIRLVRGLADRASYALTADVRPVLVVVGATEILVSPGVRDIRILRDTDLGGLAREGGVLKTADVEAAYGVARDRQTWLRL
ncbi:nuclease-related domain-containing protein [Streptomyces sp. NPDC091292]|uniref:nuclease-related domain-containing protein n=1 Tax=Streptomyces sp. NPDC091292 TaxID=3365991 RepID=UPI00382C9F46